MKSYSDYLKSFFPDFKIQKLSVNAGFSCPNRDGTIGIGGCLYCRNDSFTPSYCNPHKSIAHQINEGKKFFARKYPEMKFLAYFQSFTNTYHPDINFLESLFREALQCDDIVGLVVGTRPDTLPHSVIEMLGLIASEYPVFLEIGAETANDDTLLLINRNHSWQDVVNSVSKASSVGIHCGLHLIAGLPGENNDDVLESVRKACSLPIETLKFHQLQILLGTPLYKLWKEGKIEVKPYALEDYLDLCKEIVETVPENIIIERFVSQSPPGMVVAPRWDIKNYQFYNLLQKKIQN